MLIRNKMTFGNTKADNSINSGNSNKQTASKNDSKDNLSKERKSLRSPSKSKEKLKIMHPSGQEEVVLAKFNSIKIEGSKCKPIDIAQLNSSNSQEKQALEEMSLHKWRDYLSANESIVSDVLLGQFLSQLECTSCQTSTYSFEPFYIIELAIPPNADELTLSDLLAYSCKADLLENFMWHCPNCKKERQATKTNYIYKLPPILIICFKRFESVDGKLRKNNCLITTNLKGENLSLFEKGGDTSKQKTYIPYMIIVKVN